MRRLALILFSSTICFSVRGEKTSCFPVAFDHFWFRVDKRTYELMGKSTYFKNRNFSYYEPNKTPWGVHYGHYITGGLHHLEIFDEAMPTTPEPLGVAFISEKVGCLAEIHKRLNTLGRAFVMKPDAEWGTFTQLEQNKTLAIWAAEMKPSYVGAPDNAIDRAAWLTRMRKMNGDPFQGEHNFRKVKKVVWRLREDDLNFLARVLKALEWKELNSRTFAFDGTTVELELDKHPAATRGLKSLTLELRRPYQGTKIGTLEAKATKTPPELRMEFR